MSIPVHPESASISVRSEPRQARAAARIEQILDAAALVVDDVGSEQLTTALVAKRCGASIGTVYRYFPDRIALLIALAGRNLERMRAKFELSLAADHDDWVAAVRALFDDFVASYRDIPSFRSIRTGDMLDLGPVRPAESTPIIATEALSVLSARFGIVDDDEHRAAMIRAFTVVDAVVMFAFLREDFGDQEVLDMGWEHGLLEVRELFGEPAR